VRDRSQEYTVRTLCLEFGPQGTVARQKPITVGEIVGDEYVVRGGLKAGERVIVSNVQKLGDGAPVAPTPAAAAASKQG